MRVGFNGMGKLGLPTAYTFASRGHEVLGYDISPSPYEYVEEGQYPHQEAGLPELMSEYDVTMVRTLGELVAGSEIIFVPIQTPHDPLYEGVTRLPETRADFDYSHLKAGVGALAKEIERQKKDTIVSIISTALPGTMEREIKPLLNPHVKLAYQPMFIAMGQVVEDVLNPEFNLIGVEDEEAADQLELFYATINNAPNIRTDITTAEGIKVSYNTWITAKTVLANAWGEMAERTGMNFDDIKRAWDVSGRRLWSPRYTNAGKSDGGGCHPRDNIAMSWLASEVGMSHNVWEDLMEAREDYEDWHARVAIQASKEHDLPLVLLGKSFKPETKIETGSAAILMANMIRDDYGYPFQHYEDMVETPQPAVYFIATQHERYKDLKFPRGSVVLDPFGYLEPQDGAIIKSIGRNPNDGRDTNS